MTATAGTTRPPQHVESVIFVHETSPGSMSDLVAMLHSHGFTNVACAPETDFPAPLTQHGNCDLLCVELGKNPSKAIGLIADVRASQSQYEMPILALVDAAAAAARDAALAAGANDFLWRSLDRVELGLRVRNLLAARSTHVANQALTLELQREVHAHTARLNTLIENGLLMSATRDVSKLFRHTLFEGQRMLNCDAGSLYLMTRQGSLRFAMRTRDDALPNIEIPLVDPATGKANDHYMSVYAAVHRKSVLIDNVYEETRFDVSGTKRFDAQTNYRTISMVTVPMATRGGEVSGVLQFINKLDPKSGRVVPFPPSLVTLIEALAAHAAVTFENIQLIDERKAFMESLIHTIATAIDAKSPYTGRHSERVPELALMLAEAANASNTGSLADFHYKTDDEWHEFRVGAWLHDCGKITTPEHVIDKATKLETIYNRIHEVRMRFEVLLRDAEIERITALHDPDPTVTGQAQARFDARSAQLHSDFEFVAACNIGTESMGEEQLARLAHIARTSWLRHFDDQLGLSEGELARLDRTNSPARPAPAPLLADLPHHRIQRSMADRLDPKFGFQVAVPENLYNLGEVYNLSVQRGTLTEEDRYKINEHMIHGIMMLERMPFPDSLKRVPEYAGTHHETLLGTGYPRRLAAANLSVPARIMAIADIFEALTAADRPYKTPKKFSEALSILHSLKIKGHIDAELFDLFLTSGVYLRYARKFLLPEQIDVFDVKPFLGPNSA